MTMINLRSDTQTLPTAAMLRAMADAPLGDDTFAEDPTVNRLEAIAADRLGKPAALLVLSGTMGNLVSLMCHGRPGDEVLLDIDSHIFLNEVGGMASVAGLMPMPIPSTGGCLAPETVAAAIRAPDIHHPRPRLLCLENSHNRSGGRVLPIDRHRALCRVAHDNGLKVHLDGARLFNAAVAAGVPVSDYAASVDSVTFCLSKGLSGPLGAVIAGSEDFIAAARHCRKRLGGGMRQAGVIAAAGIVALETMVDRLAEDHANARWLAERLAEIPGLAVDLDGVETNMVYVDHRGTGLSTEAVLARWREAGVLASGVPPHEVRLVTHRHIDRDAVEQALRRIRDAMTLATA